MALSGILTVAVVWGSTISVNCKGFTSVEEYIQESNRQAAAAGYSSYNGAGYTQTQA